MSDFSIQTTDVHSNNPVGYHVEWEDNQELDPPVALLKGHVSESKVEDIGEEWNSMDNCSIHEHPSGLVVFQSIGLGQLHWPQDDPEDENDNKVDGEGDLRRDVGEFEPAFSVHGDS